MPQIRLILQDDQGNPIPATQELIYQLEGELETLDQIEQAQRSSSSRLCLRSSTPCSRELSSVSSLIGGEKHNLPLNGKEHVRIKTIHGSFHFAQQRFVLPDGSSCRYLQTTGQGLHSSGIEEFCLYYCNRLSFAEVAKLLQRISGERLLCEQTLWNWVQSKAHQISSALSSEVKASRSLPLPTFDEEVDIYDADCQEVLVSSDAIQVKAQKSTRQQRRSSSAHDTSTKEQSRRPRRG